jgi:hypothetical protein
MRYVVWPYALPISEEVVSASLEAKLAAKPTCMSKGAMLQAY